MALTNEVKVATALNEPQRQTVAGRVRSKRQATSLSKVLYTVKFGASSAFQFFVLFASWEVVFVFETETSQQTKQMSGVDSDEDIPLAAQRKESRNKSQSAVLDRTTNGHGKLRTSKNAKSTIVPAGTLSRKAKAEPRQVKIKKGYVDDSDDDEQILRRRQRDSFGDDDELLTRRSKRSPQQNGTPKTKRRKLEPKKENFVENGRASQLSNAEESDKGERHRWWDDENDKPDGIKWRSLRHNGVFFTPEYEPHGLPILYDGNAIELEPKAEEVATFYAAKLHTEHVKKKTFNKNFFGDFKEVMRGTPAYKVVRKLELCDFSRIKTLLDERAAAKKQVPLQERKALKQQEVERLLKYTTCTIDGRVEKVGNYRVEPPGLFLGRGEHPLMGKVKARIYPEDVTINIGKKDPVPECPLPGHKWGKIVHNNQVTWLAGWKDSITGGSKYVFLSACSTWKGQSDRDKFEKARCLKKYIAKIRRDYRAVWKAQVSKEIRQRSIVMYLIDKLALRVGNEKGDDEADTVGCCSLRVEHLKFKPENTVEFDFLGKDSIRYQNSVQVEKEVYLNLKRFCRGKNPSDKVFHKLTTSGLNAYLKELMPGLTAKVFRTYNASIGTFLLLANLSTRQLFRNISNILYSIVLWFASQYWTNCCRRHHLEWT